MAGARAAAGPDRERRLREQIAALLGWRDAHAGFDAAVEGLPAGLRGTRPPGFSHSAWQLVEHIRVAQGDILEFCRRGPYHEKRWPEDYWPADPEPPTRTAWAKTLAAYRSDREALARLARNRRIDLLAPIPGRQGQTYLRELLLVADHTAYHVGQIIALRRALGSW